MAQLFPDVISKNLSSPGDASFSVPAEYAFAMVQVRFTAGVVSAGVTEYITSHGDYYSVAVGSATGGGSTVNPPVLNLIIKGGESFSLTNLAGVAKASITALCHRRPT